MTIHNDASDDNGNDLNNVAENKGNDYDKNNDDDTGNDNDKIDNES